jgi:hypothetical protein
MWTHTGPRFPDANNRSLRGRPQRGPAPSRGWWHLDSGSFRSGTCVQVCSGKHASTNDKTFRKILIVQA